MQSSSSQGLSSVSTCPGIIRGSLESKRQELSQTDGKIAALQSQLHAIGALQSQTLQQVSELEGLDARQRDFFSNPDDHQGFLEDMDRFGAEHLIQSNKSYFSSNEASIARFSQIIYQTKGIHDQYKSVERELRQTNFSLEQQTKSLARLERREEAQDIMMNLFGGIDGFSALPETPHRLTGDYLSWKTLQEDPSVMNHSSPFLRGVTEDGRVFISIRYTDSSGEKKIFVLHERYTNDCNWVSTSESTVIHKIFGNFCAPKADGSVHVQYAFADLAAFIQNREYHRYPSDEHSLPEETFKIV